MDKTQVTSLLANNVESVNQRSSPGKVVLIVWMSKTICVLPASMVCAKLIQYQPRTWSSYVLDEQIKLVTISFCGYE